MKVRVTFMPDREVEVNEAERLDLERQGLLAADAPVATPAPDTTPAAPAASTLKDA